MEEKIQPTIKETPSTVQKLISMAEEKSQMAQQQQQQLNNTASRKNSMTKSLSQLSIISSLLNEEEKRFLGGGDSLPKNQSNLYSTPAQPSPATEQKPQQQLPQKTKHQPPPQILDIPMNLSPDLKPLSINTISPEPIVNTNHHMTKELSKSASNLLQEQEKNLLHIPLNPAMPPGAAGSVAGGGPQKSLRQRHSPIVWLGGIQIVLSIVLVALGGLVIARGASLAGCCAGVWTGAIAGLTGAFGIMGSIRKAQTAFLACSLICVASSTLALALTGIGAVRDSNFAQQDEVSETGGGLLLVYNNLLFE